MTAGSELPWRVPTCTRHTPQLLKTWIELLRSPLRLLRRSRQLRAAAANVQYPQHNVVAGVRSCRSGGSACAMGKGRTPTRKLTSDGGCGTCVLCAALYIGREYGARVLRRSLRVEVYLRNGCCGSTAGEPNGGTGLESLRSGMVRACSRCHSHSILLNDLQSLLRRRCWKGR